MERAVGRGRAPHLATKVKAQEAERSFCFLRGLQVEPAPGAQDGSAKARGMKSNWL